ncbi:hypothetical protein BKA93DRAFT_786739 [Sparassis latifolia]
MFVMLASFWIPCALRRDTWTRASSRIVLTSTRCPGYFCVLHVTVKILTATSRCCISTSVPQVKRMRELRMR